MTEVEKELREEAARTGLVEGELLLRAADELALFIEQWERVMGEKQGLEIRSAARIAELERELAAEREAHKLARLVQYDVDHTELLKLELARYQPLIDAAKAFRAAFRCGEMVTTAALDLKDAALALPEEP